MRVNSPLSWLALVLAALLASAGCAAAPAAIPSAATVALQSSLLEGQLLYVRDGDLWTWKAGDARQLTAGGTWRQPAFSPDGREIAYVYREQNFSDLIAMASDGAASRRLARGQAVTVEDNDWNFRPAWSPDGSQIAYISDANSLLPVVWVMSKDGGGKRQIMVPGVANLDAADAISWAPDGKRLAITGLSREPTQIYVVDVPRLYFERFTNHSQGAFDPSWSPNGDMIAYIGREAGRVELRVKRVDESREARSDRLTFVRSPAWSPDGRSVAVLSAQSGSFQVWVGTVQDEGDALQIGDFRQLTFDGGIDAASGLSWSR